MKPLDLIVWVWTMQAMPEIGIMQPRLQRHLCQVLVVGVHACKIRLVRSGKSIMVNRELLHAPTQLDMIAVAVKARRVGASKVATRLERVASRTARGVL